MNILVTGASGQLGLSVRDAANCSDNNFVFSDIRAEGDVIPLDITDASAVSKVLKDNEISAVINCAAYTDVNRAESEPDVAELVNCKAAGVLAEAAAEAGALLVHISTDYVFAGDSCRPYTEADATSPLGVYGRTKLAGEKAIEASGCRYLIIRTSWLYSNYGKNFYKTMLDLTASRPVVKVVSDQTGTPTWASDLAEAIVTILDGNMSFESGVYHYSNEGVCSWYDFAKEICAGVGHLCDVMPCRSEDYPSPVRRPHFSVLDKTRFKETFGIEIPHWRESLLSCIALQ